MNIDMAGLNLLLLSLSISVGIAVAVTDIASQLSYNCLPDGVIHVHGVPHGYTVQAPTAGSACHITQIDQHDYALGPYCAVSNYHSYPYYRRMYEAVIQVTHTSSHVIGGNGLKAYRLICDPLHTEGEVYRSVDYITVRDRMLTDYNIVTLPYKRKSGEERRTGSYPQMSFRDRNNAEVYGINVGELVYLTIESASPGYIVRPENCTARSTDYYPYYYYYETTPGYYYRTTSDYYYWRSSPSYYWRSTTDYYWNRLSTTDSYYYHYASSESPDQVTELWDIRQEGCALEPFLMEKFRSKSLDDQSVVAAPLYAFHFPSRRSYQHQFGVEIECSIRVCSKGSFSCSLDVCDRARREGRSADIGDNAEDVDHQIIKGKLVIQRETNGANGGRVSCLGVMMSLTMLLLWWIN